MTDEIKKKIEEKLRQRYLAHIRDTRNVSGEDFHAGAECGYSLALEQANEILVKALNDIAQVTEEDGKQSVEGEIAWKAIFQWKVGK